MLSYNNGDITSIPKVSGTYSIGPNVTGMPFSGGCLAQVASDGYSVAITVWFGNTQYIRVGSGEVWDDWDILATATPPQEYDLPLAEGMSAVNPCTYRKNQFSEVSVGGSASGTIEVGTAIATLPSGFRPQKTVERPAVYASANGAWTGGTVAITTDGIVRAYGQISATSVAFAVDFVAADY